MVCRGVVGCVEGPGAVQELLIHTEDGAGEGLIAVDIQACHWSCLIAYQ